MNLLIRKADKVDIGVIANNVIAMALEGSGEALDLDIVLKGVSGLFEKPEMGFYLVAENEGSVIASLVIVHEWSDWRNGKHWWIHSVYVQPDFRRQGVYKAMYEHIKEEAKKTPDSCVVKLATDNSNVNAMATYESLGMKRSNLITYVAE